VNIIDAVQDQKLLGPLFKDLRTWRPWLVYLRALFGLPIKDPEELRLFRESTGLRAAPDRPAKESYVIAGRRSGKSFISALVAVYLATFKDWRPYLGKGERGHIHVIATDREQARIVKGYVSGILAGTPALRRMVRTDLKESVELTNDVVLTIKSASFRGLRGYTLLAAILEELAFWRSEESAVPDREVLAAVRPALATIPGSVLLGISTPHSRTGVLWDSFRKYYGTPGGPLVWKAASRTMNPTLDAEVIRQAQLQDPEAEWEAEFRSDVQTFLPADVVEAAAVPGRLELPPIAGAAYFAHVDPSGGRIDSMTLAVCHRERSGKIIVDCVRERRPPFNPQEVVREFSGTLRGYGLKTARADRYAGQWVTEAFSQNGIEIEAAELSASEAYLELVPVIQSAELELLDNSRLKAQLAGLERRTRTGGRDVVDHSTGAHDDLAAAVAGAVVAASREGEAGSFGFQFSRHDVYGDDSRPPKGILSRDEVEGYFRRRGL